MKNKMEKQNPYATNHGGKIEAPHREKNEPKGSRKSGEDLRVKR